MKHLRIFEEFKYGTVYTSKEEDANTKTIDIAGYKVHVIDREDISGLKSIWSVHTILESNSFTLDDLCFSNLEEAKGYIEDILRRYEGNTVRAKSFILKKMVLDLVNTNGRVSNEYLNGPNIKIV